MWMHTGLSPCELPQEAGEEQSILPQTWHGLGQVFCFLGTSLSI